MISKELCVSVRESAGMLLNGTSTIRIEIKKTFAQFILIKLLFQIKSFTGYI